MRRRPFILFLCTLFVIVIVISCFLTGCGDPKKHEKDSSDEMWQGVITLWDFPRWPDNSGNRFAWIEKKISEFEKTHPGVYIHLRPLKWEYGHIELRAAATAGTYPDIAPIAADYDFIANGYFEPVDEYFTPEELEKYEPRAIEAVTYKERIYGFPWFITTYGLFLNSEIFKAKNAAIPKNGIWTYDEFVSALQKVTFNKDKKDTNYGFNLYLSPGSFQVWGFLTMDGAEIFDEQGNFALNSPEGVSALTKLVDLATKYQVAPLEEFGNLEETRVWSDFCEKQKIAVYPAGPWAIKVLSDRYKSGEGFEFDIAQFPKGEGEGTPFALVSGYAIFKQQDEKKRAICAEFLKYITSEDEQEALDNYGVFPVYTQALEKSTENPLMIRMKAILDTSKNLPKVKNWHKIDEELISQIRLALLSQKTPSQALEDAEKAINAISSEAN
ncbi:MAG: sugar ABC transporter substrate-binding protein [Thermoanaerobacteraceae bacterium]|nr:sugar ABC transporter substrate-binding protein [Thermoanaerobacteraceae bacterium]